MLFFVSCRIQSAANDVLQCSPELIPNISWLKQAWHTSTVFFRAVANIRSKCQSIYFSRYMPDGLYAKSKRKRLIERELKPFGTKAGLGALQQMPSRQWWKQMHCVKPYETLRNLPETLWCLLYLLTVNCMNCMFSGWHSRSACQARYSTTGPSRPLQCESHRKPFIPFWFCERWVPGHAMRSPTGSLIEGFPWRIFFHIPSAYVGRIELIHQSCKFKRHGRQYVKWLLHACGTRSVQETEDKRVPPLWCSVLFPGADALFSNLRWSLQVRSCL